MNLLDDDRNFIIFLALIGKELRRPYHIHHTRYLIYGLIEDKCKN